MVSEVDLERMRRRFRTFMAAVAVVAIAFTGAAVISAYMFVDERAARAFKDGPRIAHDESKRALSARPRTAAPSMETVGNAAASPPVSGPQPQQTITGETGPMPDTMRDPHEAMRRHAHHGRRRHHRRFAHW